MVGNGVESTAFDNISCSQSLYQNKRWILRCDGCTVSSTVDCAHAPKPQHQAAVSGVGPSPGVHELSLPTLPTGSAAEMAVPAACVIKPGDAIQTAIDAMSAAGGGRCTLPAGVHEVISPVMCRFNVEIAGEGAGRTVMRSVMFRNVPTRGDPEVLRVRRRQLRGLYRRQLRSHVNITMRDLTIDGGLDSAFVARAAPRCGLPHSFAGEPCPPCAAAHPTDTFTQCGWNVLGILVWDYNMPKGHPGAAPQTLHLSGLGIRRCSMGLHVLGATHVSLMASVLDHNGNGNAYFHNAYFLRIVGTLYLCLRRVHVYFNHGGMPVGLGIGLSKANVDTTLTSVLSQFGTVTDAF